jgi:hypothetical protein
MRFRYLFGAAVVAAFLGVTGIASAAPGGTALTCTGGTFTGDPSTSTFIHIPSGNYSSITIAGFCDVVPNAVINVTGNIAVQPGALFDAQSAPSTITVGHNVTAGKGSFLGLGCLPDGQLLPGDPQPHAGHACATDPTASSAITVNGNLTESHAALVLLNGTTVNKNVSLNGGEGNDWVFKWNKIGGNFNASNINPFFFLLGFNTIGGNANLSNIWANDPEDGGNGAVNLVLNTIGQNLNCHGLGPRLSGGFIPGAVNTVGHQTTGQCIGLVGG